MESPRLYKHLRSSDQFETKKKWLIFNELIYRPTGEKVEEGFRYFHCDIDELAAAFAARDFSAISKLQFAVDEDGDADTSAVLLDLAYVPSGAFIAAQPVEYQEHRPTPIAEVYSLEGDAAKSLISTIQQLDQTA